MACANAAAGQGMRVALADFVNPTPQGTKWGLGGTCVNVGCIPKKLMHYAANLADARKDMKEAGWKIDDAEKPDWTKLIESIDMEIKMLNNDYLMDLRKKEVEYYNSLVPVR